VVETLVIGADPYGTQGEMSPVMIVIWIAFAVFVIAGMWAAFVKAGKPGWAVLVPIYNAYVLCQIAGRPGWWLILFLIPFVNIIVALIVSIDVARRFGKGTGFGIGLWLLGAIFWPILGFGSARYETAAPDPRTFD
jgi:hypothetical protein